MTGARDRFAEEGAARNDAVVARLAQGRRRRVLHIVAGAHIAALVAAIAGCLFMMRTQGIHSDVETMRDEVGEVLTMMTLGGASEAVSRHIPALIGVTARWDHKFAAKRELFRGMDTEINHVQAMHRLGESAERWRRELEGVSPMQRGEIWQKSLKARVEGEQKKWPNRTHQKGAAEWMLDVWKEFWFGLKHGFTWPAGIYNRTVEMAKGGGAIDRLGVGDRLRYILFPYRLSVFTMLRLFGIVFATSAVGYLLCWIGLKSRFGWMSYLGLIYFVYLLNIALFIVWLEVSK